MCRWVIQLEGGAGVLFSPNDSREKFGKRIGWKGDLAVGKWFSPIIGLRIGGEFAQHRGAYAENDRNGNPFRVVIGQTNELTENQPFGRVSRVYKQKFNNIGAFGG